MTRDDHVPRDRSALALVALLVLATPLLMYAGRAQSFWPDELTVFTTPELTEPAGWFEPWAGHWATIPIVLVRSLHRLVGLRTYAPYAAAGIAGHLLVVVVTWASARRLGVAGWVATAGVVPLLVLGSGRDNIFSAFQTSLTLALALGVAHLLLASHDAPRWTRRDSVALALGLTALLCSGVAVATTVGVAVAVGIRRGWALAAAHAAPLAATYLLWVVLVPDDSLPDPVIGLAALRFARDMVSEGLAGLGSWPPVAVAFAVLALAGLVATVATALRRRDRGLLAVAAGLATVAVIVVVLTGVSRGGENSASPPGEARYVHVVAALLLPWALAGVEAVRRRSSPGAIVALGVLLLGTPANVAALDDVGPSFGISPHLRSEYLPTAEPDRPLHPLLPLPVWELQEAAESTSVPADLAIPGYAQQLADLMLAIAHHEGPDTAACAVTPSATLRLGPGDTVAIRGLVVVSMAGADDAGAPGAPYRSDDGTMLAASAPIHVQVDGVGSGAGVAHC